MNWGKYGFAFKLKTLYILEPACIKQAEVDCRAKLRGILKFDFCHETSLEANESKPSMPSPAPQIVTRSKT